MTWLAAGAKGEHHLRERAAAGRLFESIGDEWLAGVEAGRTGRRKGRAKAYTATTIRDYARSYRNFVRSEFGPMPADEADTVLFGHGDPWPHDLRQALAAVRD